MCSTSANLPNGLSGSSNQSQSTGTTPIKLIDLQRYRRGEPNDHVLIDIREIDEDRDNCAKEFVDMKHIPMGKLLHMAKIGQLDDLKEKKIVLGCNSGFRSGIVARELQGLGFPEVYSVEGGFLTWGNAAKSKPEFLAILGTCTEVERITLALATANAAASNGLTCGLVLMGEAVKLVRKADDGNPQAMDNMHQGEPFKPVKDMMSAFVNKHHGYVFCCKSCVANLGLSYTDLLEYVNAIQAPDVVRMQMESKSNFQFL
eukprot:TRINITY_DN7104_c0_g2_i17.p1 TRINITY_DN7104_c0_g2~~TRINITY_DN7104_c0_g2_i17.p1  ORF type:complete len:284 (-),score=18.32 TRINITY_DN7104_c0_g2_i17:470-1246(-)